MSVVLALVLVVNGATSTFTKPVESLPVCVREASEISERLQMRAGESIQCLVERPRNIVIYPNEVMECRPIDGIANGWECTK